MITKALAGIILYSPNPMLLAAFYKNVIGVPFSFTKGKDTDHFECSFHNIQFAILGGKRDPLFSSVIPSFQVEDIDEFVKFHRLSILHPTIDTGDGKRIGSIKDIDGNIIRLVQLEQTSRLASFPGGFYF